MCSGLTLSRRSCAWPLREPVARAGRLLLLLRMAGAILHLAMAFSTLGRAQQAEELFF